MTNCYLILLLACSNLEMRTVQLPQPPSSHAIFVPVSLTAFSLTHIKDNTQQLHKYLPWERDSTASGRSQITGDRTRRL